MNDKLVLVGNSNILHVGAHLFNGAKALDLRVEFCDMSTAYSGPIWLSKINWWLLGHRPNQLQKFSFEVLRLCRYFRPTYMLSTGLAPIMSKALIEIGKTGIKRLNYLTDDPWNPAHKAPWFMDALPLYDHIFSPRGANMGDLQNVGCSNVSYLPFAYAPELHFPQYPVTTEEIDKFNCDVVFFGGADRDRVFRVSKLIKAGFKVALYGGYWERYLETKSYTCGCTGPEILRKAVTGAKIALCLVRRDNRDGQCMRSFEIPAIGGCMLTEDTEEHRNIFGKEGENVLYFRNIDEMINKTKFLLDNETERKRLAHNAHNLIVKGNHTYRDRLITMMAILNR